MQYATPKANIITPEVVSLAANGRLMWRWVQSDRVREIRTRVRFHSGSKFVFAYIVRGCGRPSAYFVAVDDPLCGIDEWIL